MTWHLLCCYTENIVEIRIGKLTCVASVLLLVAVHFAGQSSTCQAKYLPRLAQSRQEVEMFSIDEGQKLLKSSSSYLLYLQTDLFLSFQNDSSVPITDSWAEEGALWHRSEDRGSRKGNPGCRWVHRLALNSLSVVLREAEGESWACAPLIIRLAPLFARYHGKASAEDQRGEQWGEPPLFPRRPLLLRSLHLHQCGRRHLLPRDALPEVGQWQALPTGHQGEGHRGRHQGEWLDIKDKSLQCVYAQVCFMIFCFCLCLV